MQIHLKTKIFKLRVPSTVDITLLIYKPKHCKQYVSMSLCARSKVSWKHSILQTQIQRFLAYGLFWVWAFFSWAREQWPVNRFRLSTILQDQAETIKHMYIKTQHQLVQPREHFTMLWKSIRIPSLQGGNFINFFLKWMAKKYVTNHKNSELISNFKICNKPDEKVANFNLYSGRF